MESNGLTVQGMIQLVIGVTLQTVELEGPAVEEDVGLEAIVRIAVGGCGDLNGSRLTIMYLILKMTVKVAIEMKRKMRRIDSRLQ